MSRRAAVLDVLSSTPARAKRLAPFSSARLAPSPDGPLTHFASPRGEKCRLVFDPFSKVRVAIVLRQNLDADKRQICENEFRRAIAASDTDVGNPIARRRNLNSLLDENMGTKSRLRTFSQAASSVYSLLWSRSPKQRSQRTPSTYSRSGR